MYFWSALNITNNDTSWNWLWQYENSYIYKRIKYTDFFHVKQDSDPLFIANVDTLDAHVDFKYSAFILFSSFVEVALAFLQRYWKKFIQWVVF